MPAPFEAISLERRNEYLERFLRCPERTSDYSLSNIWGWANEYGLEWSFDDSHVWLRQTQPKPIFWAPVGPWHDVDWNRCPHLTKPCALIRVPGQLVDLWKCIFPNRIAVEEARGHWDYFYSVEKMISLKGNKLHRKKNHLNAFKRQYRAELIDMLPDCVEEVLELQAEWFRRHKHTNPSPLLAENTAVARVLTAWDHLPGLIGASLHIDKTMVAYTVAEPLTEDTLVIHFEKGSPKFRGVYQAINQMFLERNASSFTHVNREQDLDDEGLRQAKLSYYPAGFLKKYTVRLA
ncbi:DUF2156 domain-containing protein [Desulfovibrionales bacterium]